MPCLVLRALAPAVVCYAPCACSVGRPAEAVWRSAHTPSVVGSARTRRAPRAEAGSRTQRTSTRRGYVHAASIRDGIKWLFLDESLPFLAHSHRVRQRERAIARGKWRGRARATKQVRMSQRGRGAVAGVGWVRRGEF